MPDFKTVFRLDIDLHQQPVAVATSYQRLKLRKPKNTPLGKQLLINSGQSTAQMHLVTPQNAH